MNTLLIYMVKAAFYMAAFYFVYSLMLSKDTLYKRNRAFIILSVISAFLLPLITIYTSRPVTIPFFGIKLSEVLVTAKGTGTNAQQFSMSPQAILMTIYIAGSILFFLKLLFDLGELIFLIASAKKKDSNIITFNGLNTAGFSALGYIFINSRLSASDSEQIISHEQNHLDHYHFLDIILLELVKVVQWFNPFVHMFNRSLRAVHEYQADEGCLTRGITVSSYQSLIMNQVFRSNAFSITNSFSNPTLIKKRMIMMTKKRSGTLANLKLLMVVPAVAAILVAFSSCKGKTSSAQADDANVKVVQGMPIPADAPPPPPVPIDTAKQKVMLGDEIKPGTPPPPPPPQGPVVQNGDTAWVAVDKIPVFPGGEAALQKFISANTKYPDMSREKGTQGRVIVRFYVSTKGEIKSASVIKSVSTELDAEALRVVNLLPKFDQPGYQHGVAVPVWYMVPITFSLK
jgi:TonB family protein